MRKNRRGNEEAGTLAVTRFLASRLPFRVELPVGFGPGRTSCAAGDSVGARNEEPSGRAFPAHTAGVATSGLQREI